MSINENNTSKVQSDQPMFTFGSQIANWLNTISV